MNNFFSRYNRTNEQTSISSIFFFLSSGSGGPSVTSCTGSEIDKQVGLWERRVKGLRRMILGWDQTKPPDLLNRIDIDVTGCGSVSLRLYEPLEGAISTKFKGKQTRLHGRQPALITVIFFSSSFVCSAMVVPVGL